MKRKLISFGCFIFLMALIGCNETLTQKVQQGVLNIDKTLNIGNAFNNYKFFKTKSWKEEKDEQGRLVVVFEGILDADTDVPINEALYKSKSIKTQDFIDYVDLVTYYKDFPLSINKQLDDNKKEADRIAREAEGRRGLTAKLSITFVKSLKDDDIVVLNKKILIVDANGNQVEATCDQEQASGDVLVDIYKNSTPDSAISECIFKSKMVPINSLKEFPRDIEYLRSTKK